MKRLAAGQVCLVDTRFVRLALAAIAAFALLLAVPAQSQSWPAKPVRLIVPFPAGAAPDVIARIVADRLAALWEKAVIVDNRPGAGGIPGMSALARSSADGYTIGLIPAAVVTLTPQLYKNPQFNIDADVVPVATIATSPMMVVVSSASGINSLADLVKASKAQPGKLNFSAAQTNSLPHLTGEMLGRTAGVTLTTIPYSGSPTATTAVLTGEATVTVDGLPALAQYVKTGRLHALAVTSRERLPGFETIPTVAETYPGFESLGWFVIFAPAGVPASVVEQVNRDVNKILQQPELISRFAELGVYPKPGTPRAAAEFIREQRTIWKKIVGDMGLQPQ